MNYPFEDIPTTATHERMRNIPNSPLTISTPVDIIHRACGINSVVECHLAKVKVASPNLVFRSIKLLEPVGSGGFLFFRGTTDGTRFEKLLCFLLQVPLKCDVENLGCLFHFAIYFVSIDPKSIHTGRVSYIVLNTLF